MNFQEINIPKFDNLLDNSEERPFRRATIIEWSILLPKNNYYGRELSSRPTAKQEATEPNSLY